MKKNGEAKDIYFIILYRKKEKVGEEDFVFKDEIKPKKIFTKEIEEEGEGQNKKYFIQNVFKYDKRANNGEIEIQFEIDENKYIIFFNIEDKFFYYDYELKRENKLIKDSDKSIIDQNFLDYCKKFELFLEALKSKQEEEGKIDTLYEETIKLYSQKNGFYLLVSLFTKIYNKKDLCIKLIKEFYKINKDKRNEKNMDRKNNLNQYISIFSNIYSDADNLIRNNGYNSIQFYGIIFCYLNYYDYGNFKKCFLKLYKDKYEVLYEILITYDSNLINPIVQDLEFFVKLFEYIISKKEFDIFENLLNLILDTETFIISLDKTKEKIKEKYKNDFRTIKAKDNLVLYKREKGEEINIIIPSIESIINFSKENEILLIYFCSNFWKNILKHYDEPNIDNIDICYRLRKAFVKYNYLINIFFDDKNDAKNDKKGKQIKIDINQYFNRDEFAFILDKNIINFIKNKKEILSDAEILGIIEKYDPYYKEDKYKYKRETNIIDYIKFEQNDKIFIETFKILKFVIIFKENITNFLNKILSRVNNIFKFGVIIDLIDINQISKPREYISQLKKKYEDVIKNQIDSLNGINLEKAIKIIAYFVTFLFTQEKNLDFLEQQIEKLNIKTRFLIYKELTRGCQGEEYLPIKEFTFNKYFNREDDIDNIISIFDSLSKEDQITFLRELVKKCSFTKEEFFSNRENKKIKLLYEYYEKGIFDKIKFYEIFNDNEYLLTILDEIRFKIEFGDIKKQKLEQFLNNEKNVAIKRLGLIKLILGEYDHVKAYYKIKKIIEEINNNIKELSFIKETLSIFHREAYFKEIKEIAKIIHLLEEGIISNYDNDKMRKKIETLKKFTPLCSEVNSIKDFLLFKVIYNDSLEKNEEIQFNKGINKLKEIKNFFERNSSAKEIYGTYKEIFNKLKILLCNDESKIDLCINQIILYFNIKNEKLIDDLTIILKSKKYEMDLKRIAFFFKCFNPNDKKWNNIFPKEYETLSKIELEELKKILIHFKKNKIYDYEKKNNYLKLFTFLYEKREAIDFLLSNTNKDIKYLYDRIIPNNQILTIKDIQDCEECIKIFKKFKEFTNNFDLYEYIKIIINNEQIKFFESYSKNYSQIIELDINGNSGFNLFEIVNKIVQNSTFILNQDNENFCYDENNKINMEELIQLKNKIHINFQKENKNKDKLQIKCEKLIFFKENISNLEMIYNFIKALRTKGSSLPILININLEYPNKKYILNQKETNFENIKDFLFKVKMELMLQLDLIYKQNIYLRFLYGKLFNNIIKHLNGGDCANDILRYILNKINNKEDIINGEVINQNITYNYIEEYKLYIENSFLNISHFINSLFEKNGTSLQKHYEKMLIKASNKYKGFYCHKCENGESMEEFIINIFLEKIGHLPISQNVLIMNKEVSPEEIRAFFYKAILCDYNTLFVVEIDDSISNSQQNIMYNIINSILSKIKGIDMEKAYIYLKSCIVIIYNDNIKDNSFFYNLERLNVQEIGNIRRFNRNIYENITVIPSDICGLGKSHKIKKMIESYNKQYYHFLLGGKLTKAIIYEKLSSILKKIKKESGEDYEKVSIHLDLKESKDTSLINEFLFSFLITKFYIFNENIIYIPKDIQIYIEIPNCFENYLSKFGILNIFNCLNISLDNIPNLDLPKDIINTFSLVLEYDSNEKIEKFIKENIGIKKYSYYQVIIFIKLFISQYGKFGKKLKIVANDKEVTEEYIHQFAKSTKYFTYGGFIKMIEEINDYKSENIIDLLSNIYENDFEYENFDTPLIFINKEKKISTLLRFDDKYSNEFKNSEYYLSKIKKVLNIPNDVEKEEGDKKLLKSILNYKTDNFVISEDTFRKMILLVYRIKANIPVIIMGETGCGKTLLVIKLNQILNNGKITVRIIKIHPNITEKDILKEMKRINEEAKHINGEIWILFDEMNTSQSLSLLTEIFINRTYNGEKINENIRLIGTCTPYRKRKVDSETLEIYRGNNNENELVYLVQLLPQSLLYFVFNFGLIGEEDERQYIFRMIEDLFSKEEIKLHEITSDAISECHKFLRKRFDPSIVSLIDISRFYKLVKFFQKYFCIKDEYLNKDIKGKEKLYKIKSIICSIYICYFIRLNDFCTRANFEHNLIKILLKLVNAVKDYEIEDEEDEDCCCSLFDQIKYKELKEDLEEQRFNNFSGFLEIEEEFLLDLMELDKGIGKTSLLKECVFLLFISVITKIPLIIIGKPGTGKSLSAQLIYNSFKGKYSKNKFFRKFPPIIRTNFHGSELTNPEDVEKLFEIAENKYKYFIDEKRINKEDYPISMILFEQLELAEKLETNPLKLLNSKLDDSINEGISFIGISNYNLDTAKINRALILSVQNLEERLDDLKEISKAILESISEDLIKNQKEVFDILTRAYYEYKSTLKFLKELTALKAFSKINKESEDPRDLRQRDFKEIKTMKEYIKLFKNEEKIKIDFHGNRDFYNFIKDIAFELGQLRHFEDNTINYIIENYIEKYFGGIDYEIDIDFPLIFDDIKDSIDDVKNIFSDFFNFHWKERRQDGRDKNIGKIKFSSVFLFKKIYNLSCEYKSQYQHKIGNENCERYDIYKCINDYIDNTNNSSYLLLEINPVLLSLIYQIIKIQNPHKTIEFYDGSPFIDDNNNEYLFKILNKIQNESQTDKLIILHNLNKIHPFLYNLYNNNYVIKDGQKYSKIIIDNFNEQLIPVNDLFKIIILVDRKFMDELDFGFLSRFEKIKITYDQLLDNQIKILTKRIIEEINLNYYIEQRKINYEIKDLLINYGEEEIGSMIYNIYINYKKEGKKNKEKEIEEEVYSKIAKMLCQDIICILPDDNIIKRIYLNKKKYYNLEKYITDNANKNYKISIVYTFNSITNNIKGVNNEMKFVISEIKSENELKYMIDNIINLNENNKILKENNIMIQFEQKDLNKAQFIINFIDKYYREGKYEKYKFIFIIHIKRNFSEQNNNRIYLMPLLNQDINQLFIDNLNAEEINLEDLMKKDIKSIIEENDHYTYYINKAFNKSLIKFVDKEINKNILNLEENNIMDVGNYIYEIEKYMNKDKDFKNDIIKKVNKLINNDEEDYGNCKSIIDKLMQMNYIDKNSLDIISCFLDYIGEEIFSKYFEYIFKVLEDNNILTTLKDINNSKDSIINETILKKIRKNALDKIDKINYKPKFLSNFKIPGFYNLYKNLSTFINKNISIEYSKNESILRKNKSINEKEIKDFHEKEEILVSSVYDKISDDKFIFDIINEIPYDLIIKDYINYYVNKYSNIISRGDFNKKLIEILLSLRFNKKKYKVIKNSKIEYIKIIIIEIIWMEANINYISNIVKLFEYSKDIFNDGNRLFNMLEEKIADKDKSIIDENKKYISEVNECYYIFLKCFCLCMPSDEISLTKSLNLESSEKNKGQEEKEEINKCFELFKKINIILKELNNNLEININEASIIDKIIEIIENKDKIDKINERKGDPDSDSESSDESDSYESFNKERRRKRRRKESSSCSEKSYDENSRSYIDEN